MSPTNYKMLGQSTPAAGVETIHYEVPSSSTNTLVRGINITNTSSSADQYTIAINPLNLFIATPTSANQGSVGYSKDGVTWFTSLNQLAASNSLMLAPVYGNGKFMTTANGANQLYTSTNGINWTAAGVTTAGYSAGNFIYGNNVFVMWGSTGFAYSLNSGATWTSASLPGGFIASWMVYGNGKFIVGSNGSSGKVYTSTTIPATWVDSNTTNPTPNSFVGGNNINVAFGAPNTPIFYGGGKFLGFISGTSNVIVYSTDGINWTSAANLPTSTTWYGVTYGNGKFVAIGYEATAYSTDGISWTAGSMSALVDDQRRWKTITYGNGKFVAAGDYAYTSYSTDGINWTSNGSFATTWWPYYLTYQIIFPQVSNLNYISYNNTIQPNTTISLKAGYTLQSSSSTSGKITVGSTNGNLTFTSFGAEIS
jgi:hypothetical protein